MKKRMNGLFGAVVIAVGLGTWAGCSSAADDGDSTNQNVKVGDPNCKIFLVKEQKLVKFSDFAADPARKNDPVVQKLFAGGKSCPETYSDINNVDAMKGCNAQTRIISEVTAMTSKPAVGRALSSRQCGNEQSPSLFFLLDPVDTSNDKSVPEEVEVIGNDTSNGVFSFYAREGKDPGSDPDAKNNPILWKFYGTSADFVTNDYDCDTNKFSGACQSKLAQDQGVAGAASGVRCASCHPGGGLVQKELNSPWTNWQQNPGDYIAKNSKVLGSFQNGDSFEGVTTPMNAAWAKKRIQVLTSSLVPADRQVKELLRPLFCTMDINLQSGGTFSVRNDLMIDAVFAGGAQFFGGADAFGGIGSGAFVNGQLQSYASVIKANGQAVPSSTTGDTADAFMYPERSNLDNQYVSALKDLIGEDLIRDILFVDFTRPIFSPTRCSLVDLPGGLTNPKTARADLLAKLQGGTNSDAEKEFLDSLNAQGTGAARHATEVSAYKAACQKRASDPKFTEDVVRYASHLRRVARLPRVQLAAEKNSDNPDGDFGIIDFDETLPKDKFDQQGLDQPFFSRTDCTLQGAQ